MKIKLHYEDVYELAERSAKLSAIERVLESEDFTYDSEKIKAIKTIVNTVE